ncbi:PspC domain-containing protein, partial [Allosphingosinicella sp.]|uniref:PspC domain-containing protein n=1 Tax=Allosphingosinicella sp. TaxID=2823234 RepID=UPI002EED0EDA
MTASRTKFYLDKENKKWLGVCSGIADYTGLDVTVVRIAMVALTLVAGGTPLVPYFVAAWMAPVKPGELAYQDKEDKKFWQGVRSNPRQMA